MPSMLHATTSPGCSHSGGSKPMPTPAGVPMEMIVPGRSVMPWLSSAITYGTWKIMRSVVLSCRSSPLMRLWIFCGLRTSNSSGVTIHGPIGVKPSRLLPRYHCLCWFWIVRALTSFKMV